MTNRLVSVYLYYICIVFRCCFVIVIVLADVLQILKVECFSFTNLLDSFSTDKSRLTIDYVVSC